MKAKIKIEPHKAGKEGTICFPIRHSCTLCALKNINVGQTVNDERANLDMLYTEIAAISSISFSDKIHELIKASTNTYGTLEEISRLEDIKTLLLKGIGESKILKVIELQKEKLILGAMSLIGR